MNKTNEELARDIMSNYGNTAYANLSGDKMLEVIPDALHELWAEFKHLPVTTGSIPSGMNESDYHDRLVELRAQLQKEFAKVSGDTGD